MPLYTHTTLLQARTRLAELLGDPGMKFWLGPELDIYLREALRVWGLYTHYWKDTVRIDTTVGQGLYDIPSTAKIPPSNFIQSYTRTDRDLINEIAYHLIEPPIVTWAGGWIGSEMFTLNQIVEILERARDQFFEMTGVVLTEQTYTVTPGVNRVELLDTLLRIDRVTIQETNEVHRRILWHNDQNQLQTEVQETYQPAIGLPRQYSVTYTPKLTVDLWPKPQNGGTLRLLAALGGADLNPTSVATVVAVPDDAAHILKYRVLSDLLSTDGLSRAYELARYCDERWFRDMAALDSYQSLLWCEVNGKRVTMTTQAQLDLWLPDWERSTGEPRYITQPSWNLLNLGPKPDQAYQIVFEMVRKAPVPLVDADFLQIDRARLQSIYDYAQHLASFKMQGFEFNQTRALLESFFISAEDYNRSQSSQSPTWRSWRIKPRLERLYRPWREEARIDIDPQREEAA